VCRERSVEKLDAFKGRITAIPGATNDREVIKNAVAGCDGVLVVPVPRGSTGYSSGTAQAVLDHAEPRARLVFSCGWHITRDGQDVYSRKFRWFVKVFGSLARLVRFADPDDQVDACRRVFASDTRWAVVRGSDLEEGESQGLPVWSRHEGDPILKSNIRRRVDFALFVVEALETDELVHDAPAIVGCQTPSALAHAASGPGLARVPRLPKTQTAGNEALRRRRYRFESCCPSHHRTEVRTPGQRGVPLPLLSPARRSARRPTTCSQHTRAG
jgi:NAD(P)H-binding